MTNDELLAAWKRKLPSVEPTDRELSAFALGVEVGQADAVKSERRAITMCAAELARRKTPNV